MRPARIFAAVLLTATVAATGAYIAHSTATRPAAAAPTVPVATTPTPTIPRPTPKPSPQPPGRHTPDVPIDRVPAPQPVLNDGEFEGSHSRKLSRLATDAFNTWFTLIVTDGVVQEIQEH